MCVFGCVRECAHACVCVCVWVVSVICFSMHMQISFLRNRLQCNGNEISQGETMLNNSSIICMCLRVYVYVCITVYVSVCVCDVYYSFYIFLSVCQSISYVPLTLIIHMVASVSVGLQRCLYSVHIICMLHGQSCRQLVWSSSRLSQSSPQPDLKTGGFIFRSVPAYVGKSIAITYVGPILEICCPLSTLIFSKWTGKTGFHIASQVFRVIVCLTLKKGSVKRQIL